MRKILLVLILVAACGEEQDTFTENQTRCEQLREHMIDLRLADAVKVDKAAHREAMREALGSAFLSSCVQLGERSVDCALDAPDAAGAAACLK